MKGFGIAIVLMLKMGWGSDSAGEWQIFILRNYHFMMSDKLRYLALYKYQ